MLDVSAAFDTTYYDILLQTKFGINGTALKWFSSYLNSRTQRVVVEMAMSDKGPI